VDYKNLNVNTRQRLASFAGSFDLASWANRPMSDLFNSLLEAVTIPHSQALDPATQATIQALANRCTDAMVEDAPVRFSEAQIDAVFHHYAMELFNGYRLGRAMLGTGGDLLHYSTPATRTGNADRLQQLLSDPFADDRLEDAGATPRVWVHYRTRVAGQGPFSVLPQQTQQAIAEASAREGVTLAVLEHDMFVEGGGSSVIAPDDFDDVAKLAVAALKANEQMGLDGLRPGCGVLALQGVDAMKANTEIYQSGDSDGFRRIVAAMPNSLDERERTVLGFTSENRYPKKAVEYIKTLVAVATELGFRDHSEEFILMIKLKPAGR
jgi:hypothetical protein